uniref:Uncharacterized protein n=1 Tax=Chenopodium quinoa TaxID=63459 RepID=A0A803N852_CHEQI
VKDSTDIKPEKIEHLWSCIQEKCSFGDPELRKDSVIQHARRLFRDSRHKLKKKYFNDQNLKTKIDRLKNKPEKMIKADWEFLVEHWSDEKVQKKKHGKDCSRVDLLIESHKRKSNKSVNLGTLANNMNVVSEMKKLTEERDQGHNNHTDE